MMNQHRFTHAAPITFILFVCIVTYFSLDLITARNSQIPLAASVALFSFMGSRFNIVEKLHRGLVEQRRLLTGGINVRDPNSAFSALSGQSQTEVLHALASLRDYTKNLKQLNERRKRLFKLMSWRQQKLCTDVGYLKKLKNIDASIDQNQLVFDLVAATIMKKYQVTYRDMEAMDKRSQSNSSLNYRVVESLGHFIRDWSTFPNCPSQAGSAGGDSEIAPLLKYVADQLDAVIPENEVHDTCIIIPGSGLGRVAHEVASRKPYGSVYAVEFSGLMHACNEFIYLKQKPTGGSPTTVDTIPFAHTNLNFLDSKAQFRHISVPTGVERPSNLTLAIDDFRYCTVPQMEKYKNVVLVSVFFIDTAENIMDYFDRISDLTKPKAGKNGFWINYGPLKYGSAAQAELNADEICQLRKLLGWNDIYCTNTLENPTTEYSNNGVSGYITDKQSMWQGYYGISMWTSAQQRNHRKVNIPAI